MGNQTLDEATKRLVDAVKSAGQSIVYNAESIVGNYDYMTDLDIHISIPMRDVPSITVSAVFIPEGYIEQQKADGRLLEAKI